MLPTAALDEDEAVLDERVDRVVRVAVDEAREERPAGAVDARRTELAGGRRTGRRGTDRGDPLAIDDDVDRAARCVGEAVDEPDVRDHDHRDGCSVEGRLTRTSSRPAAAPARRARTDLRCWTG